MSNEGGIGSTFMSVSREKIPWWPEVNADKCDGCAGEFDCLKFCPHKVYRIVEGSPPRIEVENKFNCVVFCRACQKMCTKDALSFPEKSDILKIIKEVRST